MQSDCTSIKVDLIVDNNYNDCSSTILKTGNTVHCTNCITRDLFHTQCHKISQRCDTKSQDSCRLFAQTAIVSKGDREDCDFYQTGRRGLSSGRVCMCMKNRRARHYFNDDGGDNMTEKLTCTGCA